MSPIIEGNVTYSNINYDAVLGRAQGDSDVNEAQGYDQDNIQFDFYTGDCSSYASPAGHACTTDNGSVGVCIDITPSLGSSSGNVFVCNPSSLGNSERIDAQATNQISVDLSASDSSSGEGSSGSGSSDTRYYAIQTNGNPIHSSFCYDTCGDDATACSGHDDCCLCNGENWLNYIFTEKPGTSVGATAIEVTPVSPRDDSNLPTSNTWVKITDPEAGNTTQTSDTTMRFFNIFDDAEPDVDNHDLFWTDTINRDANYMASQGTFLRESESDPVSYELVNESYTIQNFPGYIESSEDSRVGVPGYYEECLYRSVLGEEGNRCACPLNYTAVENNTDSQIDNRLCAPCELGSISDGISTRCEPCNTRGQVVNQDGECDHCRSENNLNRMYYEGECLDVGDAVIQSECVPIDPGATPNCLETHHISGSYDSLADFYNHCIEDGLCKVEQSIIEGFGNIDPVPDNIQDKNTTHDLYINEVCRSLPAPVCEMFQECSLDMDNNRCVLNLDDTQCFDTVKVPTPAQGDYQNILTLRNPSDTVLSCDYPSQENQQDTIVDGYVIPFMGNQVTQDTFTTQVTCDPLSESDIPGFVGEVKGFCLEEGQPILKTGCIPGDVMNRLTLPTTTGTESTLQNRCEELSEAYPVSLLESRGYYHSETSNQMAESGCYFQIEGGCDVTGTGGCEGATCECDTGYYGTNCSYTRAQCNDNGVPTIDADENVTCDCDEPANMAGPQCEYTRYNTCNDNGSPNEDGTCDCDEGYYGDHCSQCQVGMVGPNCNVPCTNDTTCNEHGHCIDELDDGGNPQCQCDHGWIDDGENVENQCSQCADNYYGDNCSVHCVASETCNDHGTCGDDGLCSCDTEWDGSDCSQCAEDYYGNDCEYCEASQTCNDHGECVVADGIVSCDCLNGFYGTNCSYTRAGTCSGHGSPNDDGSCNCDTHYYGNQCDVYCEASETCNDHGTCDSDGSCNCDDGYEGDTCETASACSLAPSAELEDLSSGRVYCQNGGQPTGTTEDCGCTCFNGAVGPKCEYTRDDCNSNGTPAVFGVQQFNFHCICDEGWDQESNCAQPRECSPHDISCELGKTPTGNIVDGCSCVCLDNFYPEGTCNVFCEASVTCNDHGTCNDQGTCECDEDYYLTPQGGCSQ